LKVDSRQDIADFWREYGEKIGETVLAYSMGRSLSGWTGEQLWGLIIATDGGFIFHHFPSENWLDLLLKSTSLKKEPQEKVLRIPASRLLSAEVREEKSLLKRFFRYRPPMLFLKYLDEAGEEAEFIAEGDEKLKALAQSLNLGKISS
jgi:hypothetical protein